MCKSVSPSFPLVTAIAPGHGCSYAELICTDTQLDGAPRYAAAPNYKYAASPLHSDVPSKHILAAVGSHTFSIANEGTTETLNCSETSGTSSASTCTWPDRCESCDDGSNKAAAVNMQKLGRGHQNQAVMSVWKQPDAHSDKSRAGVVCCQCCQHCIHVLAGLAPGCPKMYNSLVQQGQVCASV